MLGCTNIVGPVFDVLFFHDGSGAEPLCRIMGCGLICSVGMVVLSTIDALSDLLFAIVIRVIASAV